MNRALLNLMNSICSKYPGPYDHESPLYIDQDADGNDQAGCYLNSILIQLCSSISKKINKNVSIDISALYNCTKDLPSEKDIPQDLLDSYKKNNLWPQAKLPALLLTKIIKNKSIKLPIKCSSSTQPQSPNTNPESDCKDYCFLTVNYELEKTNGNDFLEYLKDVHLQLRSKPVICNIDFARLINPYNEPTIPSTIVNSRYRFDIDNTSLPLFPTLSNNSLKQIPHVIVCIGYRCEANSICYTFQDSYSLDADSTKPRIFDICIKKEIFLNYIFSNRIFGVNAFKGKRSSTRYTNLGVTSSKQQLEDQLNICCSPTPTPTPTNPYIQSFIKSIENIIP